MDNNKFTGVYHNEQDLLKKIMELQTIGFADEDMYVIVQNEEDISMVRGRTDVGVQSADMSFGDRFAAFLLGDTPIRDALLRTGMTEEEADIRYDEIKNGGMLLYADRDYASQYSDSYSADQEMSAADSTLHAGTDSSILDTARTPAEETLLLHEERLSIDKDRVQTGEIQIKKEVVEEQQVMDVPVDREEVIIERRPVTGQESEDAALHSPGDRVFEDTSETIRVPIIEEQIEITKKPVVTEEIVIQKQTVQDTETVRDTVRQEKARIQKEGHVIEEDNLN
ncbi:YsnF/AvaK domain-containing protein [Domibacillus tundrae]|uniref:YsnF/AvaK domain-containing protein n=1 Tax=Domibacillus tundrae TaxID=1587527 RepID=UPI00339876D4